ncbi:NAD-dependent protein deacetylase sirtuin-1, partial [Marmota marmota marmota]
YGSSYILDADCFSILKLLLISFADNLLFSDEIITNGFHSCESDEDDRASHASSSDWTPRPRIGPYTFVQQHLMIGTDPRTILKDLLPETIPPPELDDMTLWQIVINILSEPPKRKKRKDINTIEDAVKLLQECKKIIVLTGAGVSVSCGIPDFRSRDGIYARLAVDFPDLPDPQAMFDIEYFRKDPRPFFKFAKVLLTFLLLIWWPLMKKYFVNVLTFNSFLFTLFLGSIPHEVPQILINREPLPHLHFDVELLGDCDVIINELCHRLGGEYAKLCCNPVKLSEITEKPPRTQKELVHLSELPPTPLNISEESSSPERTSPPDSSVIVTLLNQTAKTNDDLDVSESKSCVEEKSQEVQTSTRNVECVNVENPDLKDVGSNTGEKGERTSVAETVRKCWPNRLAKEQISKRLDGNQYLFLPPNRYIFHGAEVYSDSEDDVLSSSSCGSNSDSGTCQSPSLEEPMEDESEIEEFYNGLEDDADVPERAGGTGFAADGGDREAVNEAISIKQEVTDINYPANKS